MTRRPIRWWTWRAFGRSPLVRTADRVEAWAVAVALVAFIAVAFPAFSAGQMVFDSRSQAHAADAATRYQVVATALDDSRAQPSIAEPPETTFMAHVRWSGADDTVNEKVVKVDHPVKAGDSVPIWLDDRGKPTTAPPTVADAQVMQFGAVAGTWLACGLVIAGAFALLRHRLNLARELDWDRSWHQFAGRGGGSAEYTP